MGLGGMLVEMHCGLFGWTTQTLPTMCATFLSLIDPCKLCNDVHDLCVAYWTMKTTLKLVMMQKKSWGESMIKFTI
jgi:hypothetical protein